MANTQVILLERVEKLGAMGDVVSVKPGFARNYLLPQKKALRASKDNIAYFEAQRKTLEADSEKLKKEAEKLAGKLEGLKVPLIRQASEAGQLFGSVSARDIAEEAAKKSGETLDRSMVVMNQNFKTIGLFPVDVVLHPEVKTVITINIARTSEEAALQAKSGKALLAGNEDETDAEEKAAEAAKAAVDAGLEAVLEDGALEAEKEKQADAEEKAAEAAKKAEEKAAAKAIEDAAKAEAAAAEAATAEAATAEAAATEEAPAEEASEDKQEDAS